MTTRLTGSERAGYTMWHELRTLFRRTCLLESTYRVGDVGLLYHMRDGARNLCMANGGDRFLLPRNASLPSACSTTGKRWRGLYRGFREIFSHSRLKRIQAAFKESKSFGVRDDTVKDPERLPRRP
jgi:hypothetical protein